jgi:hypothetical protein
VRRIERTAGEDNHADFSPQPHVLVLKYTIGLLRFAHAARARALQPNNMTFADPLPIPPTNIHCRELQVTITARDVLQDCTMHSLSTNDKTCSPRYNMAHGAVGYAVVS